MNKEIQFPIMDMTEFVFEGEKVFFSYSTWKSKYILKEKYIKKLPKWKFIDTDGKILKVKIIKKNKIKNVLPFLLQSSYNLELQLVQTGKIYQLEELKEEILLKKKDMFHIYYNKLMTSNEYETKIKKAKSFLEIIDVASFEDYKEYNCG